MTTDVVFWLGRQNLLNHVPTVPERSFSQVTARITRVPVILKPFVLRSSHLRMLYAILSVTVIKKKVTNSSPGSRNVVSMEERQQPVDNMPGLMVGLILSYKVLL